MDMGCPAIGHAFYFVTHEESIVENTCVLWASTKATVTKTPIYEIIFKQVPRRQVLAGSGDLHHLGYHGDCTDAQGIRSCL